MTKWADYVIVRATFDAEHEMVEKVTRRADTGDELGLPDVISRRELIESMEQGETYAVATEAPDGSWHNQGTLSLVEVGVGTYIQLERLGLKTDHLGNVERR